MICAQVYMWRKNGIAKEVIEEEEGEEEEEEEEVASYPGVWEGGGETPGTHCLRMR